MKRRLQSAIRFTAQKVFPAPPLSGDEVSHIWRSAQTCCVIASSGIGDAIMTTPLIEQLKKVKPGIHLTIVASHITRHIFVNNPAVDEILSFNPDKNLFYARLFRALISKKVDLLFAAQPSNTTYNAWVAWVLGAKLRLKHAKVYGNESHRDFDFVYHDLLPSDVSRHRVELNLDFLRYLGEDIPSQSVFPKFYIAEKAAQKIANRIKLDKSLSNRPFVSMHPGSGRPEKQWPAERFAILARHLIEEGYRIVLVGGSNERALCNGIYQSVDSPYLVNCSGQFNLPETAAILQKSDLLISNDSGIMHLATAVKTPVVALFGPTDPQHIGPFTNHSCSKTIKRSNSINEIQVQDVIRHLHKSVKEKAVPKIE